jgi:hypothetical protein
VTIQIELKPDIEAELVAQARKTGVPVAQYVERILEQHVPSRPVESKMSPSDRSKAFRDWTETFPYRRTEPLPDDAISRDNLYRRDDE